MEELKIRKIYVDTRYKVLNELGDNGDFEVMLPEAVNLPENTVAFVDEVIMPIAFKNIQKNVNDKLYLNTYLTPNQNYYTLTLEEKSYTLEDLAATIQTALRTTYTGSTPELLEYIVVADARKMNLVITITDNRGLKPEPAGFKILTDSELIAGAYNGTPIVDPQSINDILQNYKVIDLPTGVWLSASVEFIPDLHLIRNLYVTSNMSNYSVVSNFVWQGNNIIKKIPITVSYGNMLFNNINAAHDYFRCGGQSLYKLRFTLRDARGNIVKMTSHWSFSIIFTTE